MSKLPPEHYLDLRTLDDAFNIGELPLAVVIQKRNDVKVYRVDRVFVEDFWDALGGPFASFETVERAGKQFGYPISHDDFRQASVFPGQSGGPISGEKEYMIYRASFPKKKKKGV